MKYLNNPNGIKKWMVIALIGTALTTLTACSAQAEPTEAKPSAPAVEKPAALELFGKVVATQSRQLAASKALQIDAVVAKTGARLKKGDVIATLNLDSLQRERDLAILEINQLEAQLKNENSAYLEANQRLISAEARLKEFAAQLATQTALYDQGTTTKSELDALKRQHAQAQRDVAAEKLSVTAALQSGKSNKSTVALQLAKAKGTLAEIEDTLKLPWISGNQVLCPIESAILENLHIQSGQFVAANSPIATLIDEHHVVVRANASEDVLKRLSVGQSVEVTPLMDKSTTLKGEIAFISAQGEQQGGETTVPVQIVLKDTNILPLLTNVDVSVPQN